jgi:ATP-dependent RNA helicase DeaD
MVAFSLVQRPFLAKALFKNGAPFLLQRKATMIKKNFSAFELSHEMSKAIAEMGFEEATPIQSLAIGPILAGADIIGQAQTGTGKTASFGIPIIDRIEPALKKVQALILCPTRELAVQIAEELKLLGKYKKDIRILPVYGGQPIERQIAALQRGVQVVVGTPGRVRDHMERKTLHLDAVRTVMLDMGFVDEMKFILAATPAPHQTLLFSATMPRAIMSLSKSFQTQPELIRMVHEDLTVPGVEQTYYEVKEFQKTEMLARLIDIHDLKRALVFCNTKIRVDELVEKLQARGYTASGLHGDMKQMFRDRVMNQFRSGRLEILVATDVAARGLDVEDIEVVVNYDVPRDEEYYVHRIGRTARAGKSGRAFTFVAGRELGKLAEIQRFAKTRIRRQRLPSVDDVDQMRNSAVLERIRQIMETETGEKYTAMVEQLTGDDHSSLDVAAALLKMIMEKDGKALGAPVAPQGDAAPSGRAAGEAAPRVEMDEAPRRPGKPARDHGIHAVAEPAVRLVAGEATRLKIRLGKDQGIRPGDIVGAITGETDLVGRQIGAIEIHDSFSLVDVPQALAAKVIQVMSGCQIKGHPVFIKTDKHIDKKKKDK